MLTRPTEQKVARGRRAPGRGAGGAIHNRLRASTAAIGLSRTILNQAFNLDHRSMLEMEAFARSVASGSEHHSAAVARFVEKQPAVFDREAKDRAQADAASDTLAAE